MQSMTEKEVQFSGTHRRRDNSCAAEKWHHFEVDAATLELIDGGGACWQSYSDLPRVGQAVCEASHRQGELACAMQCPAQT